MIKIPYCTAAEVRAAIDFPATGAPIEDSVIGEFILDAEEEIENLYHTKFGNVEDSGTADGDFSTTTFSDSGKSWTADEYVGYVVWIYGGTGSGQYREIASNTATKITVSPAFSTTPDATSAYRITKLGYKDETVDGSGIATQFTIFQPLISLNALTIDSVSVTPSYVYQYNESGRLELSSSAESSSFTDSTPQLVNMKYVYGVYPLPRPIKRLCVCIAAIKTLTAQIAGTYDDFTSVSLPAGFSASKGEPYMNIKSALDYLQAEAKGIVFGSVRGKDGGGALGDSYNNSGAHRPFTKFG